MSRPLTLSLPSSLYIPIFYNLIVGKYDRALVAFYLYNRPISFFVKVSSKENFKMQFSTLAISILVSGALGMSDLVDGSGQRYKFEEMRMTKT